MKARPLIALFLLIAIFALAARLLHIRGIPGTSAHIPGSLIWTRGFGESTGYFTASVLGPDGTLYVANIGGVVYAVDSSGGARWQYRTDPTDSIAGGLVMDDDGNLYYGTLSKEYSLDKNGLKRWDAACVGRTNYRDDQGAAVDGNILYAECGRHFVAFDKDHGTQIWDQPAMDLRTAPVVTESGTVLTLQQGQIVASDRTGAVLWTFPGGTSGMPSQPPQNLLLTPLSIGPDGDVVTARGSTHRIIVLDSQGTLRHEAEWPAVLPFYSSPAVAPDGSIYAVTPTGVLYAYSSDCTFKWRHILPNIVHIGLHAPPTIADDGTIYVLGEQSVYAISPDEKVLWSAGLPGNPMGAPSLGSDGVLYVTTLEGHICAIQTASHGLATGGWPKYQGDSRNSGRASATEPK